MHWFLPFFVVTGIISLITLLAAFDGAANKKFMRETYVIYGLALIFAYCVYGFIKIV